MTGNCQRDIVTDIWLNNWTMLIQDLELRYVCAQRFDIDVLDVGNNVISYIRTEAPMFGQNWNADDRCVDTIDARALQ